MSNIIVYSSYMVCIRPPQLAFQYLYNLSDYPTEPDIVWGLVYAVILATFVEIQMRRHGARGLVNKEWKTGEVYLYTMEGPHMKTLQVETGLRLLGIRFEKKYIDIPAGETFPFVEMEGQQLTDFEQIIRNVCTIHTSIPWSGYFQDCLNDSHTRREAEEIYLVINGAFSACVTRGQWEDNDNCKAMLSQSNINPEPMWPSQVFKNYKKRRSFLVECKPFTSNPLGNYEEIHRHVALVESFLAESQSIKRGNYATGINPGPHDCSIYAALKVVLDSPLPVSLVPTNARYPFCRLFMDRMENLLDDL
eukprot:TRINITY_DN8538_c2_g1_i1.p1 TRINITY_DN8538_c2_g1~~TRINITY_DN8538_c2_g1_i1.p1  ORF type:complete len:320 (+),score=49.10 TRINITY_DN8538_c2_g1_i1:44-961(+)